MYIGLFYYFVAETSYFEKQFMAKRSKWHSRQVVTSKSGNLPNVFYMK